MDPKPTSMWSSIVKKDPPSKPPVNDGAPAAILGMVGNCKSTKGISMAVVDANAVIEGGQSLTNFADRFVTVPEVLSEIRDPASRRRLAFIPFTIDTMEPSPESLSKVIKFARATGDLQTLSDVDLKLIALSYTLEAQVHGTKNLRDVPPPIQTVRVKRLPEKDLPGWGSNVSNLDEWEALENETEEISNANSKILPLKDLNMNIIASDNVSEVGSVVSHTENHEVDEQEGEKKHRRYPPKKTEIKLEGKMVVKGIDASQGQYDDDDDASDWRPAVSRSTHRRFLRRKATWEHHNALAEQEIQQDQEADKARNMIEDTADLHQQSNQMSKDPNENHAKDSGKDGEDLSSILKDMRLEEDSLRALHEGTEETNAEATLVNGEDDIEVEAEGIDVTNQALENLEIGSEAGDTFEASSIADDGSSEQSWSLRALSESSVACITGDYAMQNVILQMGLRLLAPGGMQIRQLHRWILKCHACYTVTPEIGRIFCPKCGNGGTLRKVAVTIGENGAIIAACKPRIILRGTQYSIPMPKGGREAITKNLILREDQLPQKFLHPRTKKKASKPGDEYFVSDDVFLNHHSDRKAPLQPPVRKAMSVFSQKRNPNDNHYSRSMH
ncbi:NOB1 zinc finger-like superfamily [Arabidopsis thaliana x Arabidopsis arenosa]|uniref:NOB1 zinc finger-like superfamily n=1 Tax=Arabidopsis thaliana x Arabidopsis arenosa TaxID=1240361 RepID=A0A8T1YDS9_9BRAS|nr:NOB1 zinc finger-like superfamily [Arabidopsis thaliana x Arabidopsis arenosa]